MASSVVREADAPDHAEDPVGIADGIAQSFEGHAARSLRGNQTVRVLVEGTAAARGREGLERGEPHVDEEIVGSRDRGREHEVRPLIGESVAGELDRVERTRAGGVQGEGAVDEAKVQGAGREERGQARGKSIPRIDAVGRTNTAPYLLREMREARGREREVREDEAGPRTEPIGVLDPLHGFARGVKDELEERVEAVDLGRGKREARRIETVFEAAHVAAAKGADAVVSRPARARHQLLGIDAPAPVGDGAQQVLAGEDAVEQLLRAESARKSVRLGDDRDRFETFQARGPGIYPATTSGRCPPCAFRCRATRTAGGRPRCARWRPRPS